MINIGEISKPSVSESPVRPKRSTSDGELVTPVDSVVPPSKVSTKNKKDSNKKRKFKKSETASTISSDKQLHDDDFYDETGHQEHHGEIDLNV